MEEAETPHPEPCLVCGADSAFGGVWVEWVNGERMVCSRSVCAAHKEQLKPGG